MRELVEKIRYRLGHMGDMPIGGFRYRFKKRFHKHDMPLAMGVFNGRRTFMCTCGVIWTEDQILDKAAASAVLGTPTEKP